MTELERIKAAFLGRDMRRTNWFALMRMLAATRCMSLACASTAKSNLLEHRLGWLMANGDGLCFIDPLIKSADKLMRFVPEERREDVIFWDVANRECCFGLNPFFCADRSEIDRKADEFLDLLPAVEYWMVAIEGYELAWDGL